MNQHDVQQVLERFGVPADSGQPVALGNAGGFSGAMLWRLNVGASEYCLRRWPSPHPNSKRLELIQRALVTAHLAGVECLPVPISDLKGSRYVELGNRLWELSPWMPGHASYSSQPSAEKLASAFTWLARFHVAVSKVTNLRSSVAPAVVQRIENLEKLNGGGAEHIANAVQMNREEKLDCIRQEFLAEPITAIVRRQLAGVLSELKKLSSTNVPLQFCIRDIWHDHLLFSGDELTGVVDFGACNTDVVSTDIARLAGSMVGDDMQLWNSAINTYETVRPLSNHERDLIRVLDNGTVLISGMNWLRWLFVENRQFDDLKRVLKRLQLILERLKSLDESTDFAI